MKKSSFLSAIALVVIAGFLFTACPPEAEDTYSVTYDGNGNTGGSVPTDSTDYGANATVTVLGNTGTLVKTGYTFDGWNTLANGTGTDYAAGATFAITANTTLYAKWTAAGPIYTVTFNTDGGSTAPAPITAVSGTTITLPTAPTKTSYDFAGWFTAVNGGGTAFTTTTTVTANITVYAKWTEGFENVSENYPLATGDSGINTIGQPTTLDITAKKSKVDGTVYLTVTSKAGTSLTGVEAFTGDVADLLWGTKGGSAPSEGKWADMALNLSAVFTSSNKFYSIKNTNEALRYYTGQTDVKTIPTALATPVIESTYANLCIPTETTIVPYKWKLYPANTLNTSPNTGMILWSNATSKIITLEIAEYASHANNAAKVGDIAKIVIDYSGVNIQ